MVSFPTTQISGGWKSSSSMAKLIKTTELLKKFSKFGTKNLKMAVVYFGRRPKSDSTEELHIDLHGSQIKLNRLAIGHIELI